MLSFNSLKNSLHYFLDNLKQNKQNIFIERFSYEEESLLVIYRIGSSRCLHKCEISAFAEEYQTSLLNAYDQNRLAKFLAIKTIYINFILLECIEKKQQYVRYIKKETEHELLF